jgi:hypothetical protein
LCSPTTTRDHHRRPALWVGLTPFVASHADEMIDVVGWQIARMCTTWLTGTPLDWPLPEQLADVAVTLGRHTLAAIAGGATFADDLDTRCWKALLDGMGRRLRRP